jgi:hypothetical protein
MRLRNCEKTDLLIDLRVEFLSLPRFQRVPQFALLDAVPRVQLSLILGSCGSVAVASFLGGPSPLQEWCY